MVLLVSARDLLGRFRVAGVFSSNKFGLVSHRVKYERRLGFKGFTHTLGKGLS